MTRLAALLLALALAASSPGLAQPRGAGPPKGDSQAAKPAEPLPAPPPEALTPPYEKDLLRLSEVLGSLAFLRGLCEGPDAAEWQKRMQALMDAEGSSPVRRERLAGAYNRGFRGYSLTYRVCTASAKEATARYLKEGEDLSRNLSGRYGG